ncbi:MAG: glucan biosynthesis protein C [Lentimonas sp.]|jgi:glucan biosynthesis protein C
MNRLIFIDNIKVFGNLIRCMIHAAVPYMVTYSAMWPFDDKGSYLFDFSIFEGHLFLMELFFILTGFMFAMQMKRKSSKEIIKNRLKKIVFPFILGLILIMPIVLSFFELSDYNSYDWMTFEGLKTAYLKGWQVGLANLFPTGHLWFLYYLIYFYVFSFILYKKLPKLLTFLERIPIWTFIAIPIIVSITMMFFMKRWLVDNPLTFIPELPTLTHYYLFFFIGVLLFYSEKIQQSLNAIWKKLVWTGGIIGVIAIFPQLIFENQLHSHYGLIKTGAIILHMIATYFLALGIWTGFKLLSVKHRKRIVYLSDANYWIYISFLPVAMFIQLLLLPFDIPVYFKFLLTYVLGLSFCLFLYEFSIRYTWVGGVLNNKRIRSKRQN